MAIRAATLPRAYSVDALVETVGYLDLALVYIHAGLLVLRELVARWTGAEVATYGVGALMRAAAVPLQTLVDVQAGGFVGL